MAFTEFCCRSGGSNLNAGTRTGSATEPGTSADFTYASGSWVSSTGVFTVASGNPVTDGVAVGDFASVYADGASTTTLIGRVTARTSTTITVSTSAKAGTTTDGTSNRTLKIGGAWAGPSGSNWFPLSLSSLYTATNAAGDQIRVNLKNNQTYTVSANLSYANNFTQIEGYTTLYGDDGKATIDSGTNAIDVLTVTGVSYNVLKNLCGVSTYTSSGVNRFLNVGSNGNLVLQCVATGFRWEGFSNSGNSVFVECEAYNCSAAAVRGGFYSGGVGLFVRCISHDNASHGFFFAGITSVIECIADSNASDGFNVNTSAAVVMQQCDTYNNTGDGFRISGGVTLHPVIVESCNCVKNGGWGINLTSDGRRGTVLNCAFGAGTQANSSGTIRNHGAMIYSAINYPGNVTPWQDPANGDFRISLAAAKGAGRGSFTQTASDYSGTVGYPDIGASQSAASGGTSGFTGLSGLTGRLGT
jgi:hypothetical protein